MVLQGKGFFIWKIQNCEGGDAARIASEAKKAGLTHVLIKIANGIYSDNLDLDRKVDLVPPVAQALRSAGIEVWGWHYVYGDSPTSEAQIAIRRVQELDLDGYVIDAETQYKASGKELSAKLFMQELKAGLGDTVPVALSSYRYPSLHPIPWNQFLEKCDYIMPQVYWMQANNPGDQLEQTLREYESPSIKYHLPIIPVGAAFKENGWEPTKDEVVEFLDTAQSLNLTAANFWDWYSCREILKPKNEVWEVIARYDWNTSPETPKDITEIYIDALNSKNADKVADLYNDRAVHVNAERTIFGRDAIRAWYETLFDKLLPNAEFSRTTYSGINNSRHFNWVAHTDTQNVLNGDDTFGLMGGKISYHYTYFTLS